MARIQIVLLVLFLVAGAAAQSNDTFIVNDYMNASKPANIFLMDAKARYLATFAVMPPLIEVSSTTMAADNQSIRVLGKDHNTMPVRGVVLEVSPTGKVRTVYSKPGLLYPYHTYPDDDGDWVVIDYNPLPADTTRFVRMRGGTPSLISVLPSHELFAFAQDPATGRLISRSRTQYWPAQHHYCSIDVRAGKMTSIANLTTIYYGLYSTKHLMYEPDTGGIVDLHYGTLMMTRTTPSTGVVPLKGVNFSVVPRDITWAGPRVTGFKWYLLGQASQPLCYDLLHIQGDGKMTTFYATVGQPLLAPITSLTRYGSRHLTWTMDRAPNDRSLQVSFPGEAGMSYAVGLSLTGIRPGVYLRDGRVISLEPDGLTQLSLSGGIPGVIEGTVGKLDPAGRARVKIHVNRFGAILKGLRVWAVALLLDPTSRLGIAYIAHPVQMTVK